MNILKKLAVLLLTLVLFASCEEKNEEKVLTFSAIPDRDSTELEKRYGALARYLEAKLGIKVKYLPVKSYTACNLAFKNDQIQLAWFGGLSGVQAQDQVPGAQAIAMGKSDAEFMTYFIANKSTGLTESSEFPMAMKGKSFTFGSPTSTSGRLMPQFYIQKNANKSPKEFFSQIGFSINHSQTVTRVNDGLFEVGAVNYKVWEEMKAENTNAVLIWKTPVFVDYNWTAHPSLEKKFGAGFTKKLQEALLSIDPASPEGKELLKLCEREGGFIKATNDMFKPIRDVAEAAGVLR